MSGKYNHYRVYFVNQPTTYYSSSAVSENAAIRQAIGAAKGLGRRGPFPVARVVNIDLPENAGPPPHRMERGPEHQDRRRFARLSPDDYRASRRVSRQPGRLYAPPPYLWTGRIRAERQQVPGLCQDRRQGRRRGADRQVQNDRVSK